MYLLNDASLFFHSLASECVYELITYVLLCVWLFIIETESWEYKMNGTRYKIAVEANKNDLKQSTSQANVADC